MFPDALISEARTDVLALFGEMDLEPIMVDEGRFLDEPLETFGSRAVVEIPNSQPLLRNICKVGFEHHCAMSAAHTADAVSEALGTYLGWEVYRHA